MKGIRPLLAATLKAAHSRVRPLTPIWQTAACSIPLVRLPKRLAVRGATTPEPTFPPTVQGRAGQVPFLLSPIRRQAMNRCLAISSGRVVGGGRGRVLGALILACWAATAAAAAELSTSEEFYKRAVQKWENNQGDEAMIDLDKAIELDPKHVPSLAERGYYSLLSERGDLGKADLDKAIELDPKYAKAFYYRAMFYRMKGKEEDYENGIADANKAHRDRSRICGRIQSAWHYRGQSEELHRGDQGLLPRRSS